MVKKGRKNKTLVRDSTSVGIIDEDYNMLADRMDEVSIQIVQNIYSWHTKLSEGVIDLLQALCKVVKDVRAVASKKEIELQEYVLSNDHLAEVQMS